MLAYVIRRSFIAVGTIWVISMIVFAVIEMPPGDAATTELNRLRGSGRVAFEAQADQLRAAYGLDKPGVVRYALWIKGMATGNLGGSLLGGGAGGVAGGSDSPFVNAESIESVIGGRLAWTIVVTLIATMFIWIMALPIGLYSAMRQYSIGDYTATTLGFLGLAIPDFLLALVLMVFAFQWFDVVAGGLFSPEYLNAEWSLGRLWDLIKHLWIPAIVLGTAGTAGTIRILRANLLDEIRKPYVRTARAKGMGELRLILKYPFRVALNPAISAIGYILPALIGGSIIVSVVLSLPTLGPTLLAALLGQDTRLAATIMLLIAALTVIGTLISDLLLAWLDPRIRKGFGG